jgi:hypothetical protein
MAIVPLRASLDVARLCTDPAAPIAYVTRDELRTMIGLDMLRWPVGVEAIGQAMQGVVGCWPPKRIGCRKAFDG